MRILLLLALLAGGCGDDTTIGMGDLGAGGDDLSAGGGADFAGTGDMTCVNRVFPGFNGVQTTLATFSCACGCTIDGMQASFVNPMWGREQDLGLEFRARRRRRARRRSALVRQRRAARALLGGADGAVLPRRRLRHASSTTTSSRRRPGRRTSS